MSKHRGLEVKTSRVTVSEHREVEVKRSRVRRAKIWREFRNGCRVNIFHQYHDSYDWLYMHNHYGNSCSGVPGNACRASMTVCATVEQYLVCIRVDGDGA